MASLYDKDDLPKGLETRKLMKLQGSLNYKLNGTTDRMAIGHIVDVSMGEFKEDAGSK